jgi:uncharacterized membrane protein YbhN (UPF0104 family)
MRAGRRSGENVDRLSGPPTQPPISPLPPPEIDSDPTLRVVEEGLPAAAPDHSWLRRHSKAVSAAFAIVVFAALVVGLYSKRDAFIDALDAASFGVLAASTLMQVIWVIARSEAWYVCVDAAGGDCGRRPLYRADAVGYLGNLLNPSVGVASTGRILRSKGVAQTAAAGALLTATGAVGALLFASWALLDRWRTRS